MVADNNIANRFKNIIESTCRLMYQRIENEIGFTDNPILIQILNESNIKMTVKKILYEFVTSNRNLKDCIKELKTVISRSTQYNRDVDWSINDLAHNIYRHYDAAYNMHLAIEFGMRFFGYQGGIIKDSRDFCVAHNNKIWSIEETKTWHLWTPSTGQYPDNYKIKSTSIYEVPNYLKYPGYDPLIDIGGYCCRHILSFVSDSLAFRERPDLRKD